MTASPVHNLRQFLQILQNHRELVTIDATVDARLELPEIHRRVLAAGGPALLFKNVSGSGFPVVSNLFGSEKRVSLSFTQGREAVEQVVELAKDLPQNPLQTLWKKRSLLMGLSRAGMKHKKWKNASVCEVQMDPPNLLQLPFTKSWPHDGGDFLTLPLVLTEHPDGLGHNLGMYRIQRMGETETGMHWQIDKGGGFHFQVSEAKNEPLPVTIMLGGPPVLILSAIAPLPENLGELLLASFLLGKKLPVTQFEKWRMVAECEFALLGEAPPGVRKPEGPFGDHYGYYSLEHPFPVFKCRKIFHRKGAIMPVTVVGKPPQEDFFIGDFLQELLSPLFPLVMPSVLDIWSYGETGYHSLAAACVQERYFRESAKSAFRILGEGQLSLTKFLWVLTEKRDLRDFKPLLVHILERIHPPTDVYVFSNLSMDTLDYSGVEINKGSKGLWIVGREIRRSLPEVFSGTLPKGVIAAEVFCPGCLVISLDAGWEAETQDLESLCREGVFGPWPLLIVSDIAAKTVQSSKRFLWEVFTRMEPGRHMHCGEKKIVGSHLAWNGPIMIDARLAKDFPEELFCDPDTKKKVDRRWKEYFPKGNVEMGEPM